MLSGACSDWKGHEWVEFGSHGRAEFEFNIKIHQSIVVVDSKKNHHSSFINFSVGLSIAPHLSHSLLTGIELLWARFAHDTASIERHFRIY